MKTILYNGKIRVSDGSFKEAVLIEDKLIKKVGYNDEILKEQDKTTELIDLGGQISPPGF